MEEYDRAREVRRDRSSIVRTEWNSKKNPMACDVAWFPCYSCTLSFLLVVSFLFPLCSREIPLVSTFYSTPEPARVPNPSAQRGSTGWETNSSSDRYEDVHEKHWILYTNTTWKRRQKADAHNMLESAATPRELWRNYEIHRPGFFFPGIVYHRLNLMVRFRRETETSQRSGGVVFGKGELGVKSRLKSGTFLERNTQRIHVWI